MSKLGIVSLVSGKRPGVKVTFLKKHWVFELESPSQALGLYNYLEACRRGFDEDSCSLWETITKNCDALYIRRVTPNFEQTVLAFLSTMQPNLTPENVATEASIRNLNLLLHHCCIGYYSNPQNEKSMLSLVSRYIIGLIISVAVKRAESSDPLTIHQLLVELLESRAVFNDLSIVDVRMDISMKFLLNMYKKLFFNQITSILSNLVQQLKSETTDKSPEEIINFPIFIDFFKTIRTFFSELVPLRSIRNFCSVTLDFKRKLFYYFFGFFKQTFEQLEINFSYTALLSMLNGVFYLVRENDQMIVDFIKTFGEHEAFMKLLLEFKRIFFRLSDSILDKLRRLAKSKVREKMQNISSGDFDIDQIVKKDLLELFQPLEKVHTYFKMRIIRFLFVLILEGFIAMVEREGDYYVSSGKFSETVDKMREFFSVDFQNQTFENYLKFLDYYQLFLKSKRIGVCETAIAMMKTILSEEISEQFVENVIRSKNFDGLRFSRRTFTNRYEKMIEVQKLGEEAIARRQKARLILGGMLLLGTNCFKFVKYLRRKFFKNKANKMHEETAVFVSNQNIKTKIEAVKLEKFNKSLPIAFFETSEFENASPEQVKEHMRDQLLKSPPGTYNFTYENEKLVVYNSAKKLMRIFHPAKFSSIEKLELNSALVVVLSYRANERICIVADKQETQTKLFEKLSKFIEIFKDAKFSDSR